MGTRRRLENQYRRFPWLTDIGGIKNAIGEMRGLGYPRQPRLNTASIGQEAEPLFDAPWFTKSIKEKILTHPDNRMEYPFSGERIFEEPLVGFVRGDDPLFQEFKRIIGPHHFTPAEIMAWQARNNGVAPPPAEDMSVVVFVMPITRKTKEENAAQQAWPSERWAQTRLLGEIFSQTVTREVVTFLMSKGVLAVSPDATPLFRKKHYPKVGWASPWSHRHIAYAAGLGTFGMHDFFITEKGCAHRMGSFVVNLRLEPDRQRPADIHAYCRQYQGRTCLKCARRCPVEAITLEHGHDKENCSKRIVRSLPYCNRNYHIFIYGCGLCSTGVPCESGIPDDLRANATQKPGDHSSDS